MTPGLVLIDFDKTLVNKDAVVLAAVRGILGAHGVAETFNHAAAFARHNTRAFPDLMRHVFAEAGAQAPDIDFGQALGDAARGQYHHATECEGATALLRYLEDNHIPFAIVSNGIEQDMKQCIAHFGWEGLIPDERIFVPARGYRAKPDPDMLRVAMTAFLAGQEHPEKRTAMIGDSKADADAALAAGITAIYLVTSFHDEPAAPAGARKYPTLLPVLHALEDRRVPAWLQPGLSPDAGGPS